MNDCKVGVDAISPKAKAELPQEIVDLVAERREGMRKGTFDPFTEHALVSNGTGLETTDLKIPPKGTVVKPAGEKPTDEFLLQKINFDLDGVNILP
jgi:simple sugar transport system substrate-binding protein